MSTKPPAHSPLDKLRDELDMLDDLDAVVDTEPSKAAAELKELGFDAEAIRAQMLAAIEEAKRATPAFVKPAGSAQNGAAAAKKDVDAQPSAPAKVISLAPRREAKQAKTRWLMFLPAAAAFALLGVGGAQAIATWKPSMDVAYPTYVPGPTPQEVAALARTRALRLCDLRYFGECEELLDRAKGLDPEGESGSAVQNARKYIGYSRAPGAPSDQERLYSKGPLGPGEHRLKPKH